MCLNLLGRASCFLAAPLLHKGSRDFRPRRLLQETFRPSFTIFLDFTILTCNSLDMLRPCEEKTRHCTANQATETTKRALVSPLINKKCKELSKQASKMCNRPGPIVPRRRGKATAQCSHNKMQSKKIQTAWSLYTP